MLRSLARAALVLGLTACAAEAADLTVQVEGAEQGQGTVLVGICAGSLDLNACAYRQSIQSPASSFEIVFPGLPEGSYAVAAFQDSNGDGTLNRDANGVPREPYAFSNGAGRTAPPSFEGARLAVTGGTLARIRLARSPLAK
jgi:uncharacterized protein (DUF2141 family)